MLLGYGSHLGYREFTGVEKLNYTMMVNTMIFDTMSRRLK